MWPQPCSDYGQIREVPAIAFAIEMEGREGGREKEGARTRLRPQNICVKRRSKLASGVDITCALHPATLNATTGDPRGEETTTRGHSKSHLEATTLANCPKRKRRQKPVAPLVAAWPHSGSTRPGNAAFVCGT